MNSGPFALWRWIKLFGQWESFGEGFLRTLEVSILALCLALMLGIIFGLMSTSNKAVLKSIARIYVEFFQNTPLVIQIFFMYNGLAIAGLVMNVFTIGVLGVGFYHGAYISEVVRAGITSIPTGQIEAAHSQGFTYIQTMRYVILPQTVKIVLPPLTNQAVNLIKNTSVLAMISGFDLMYMADSWASSTLDYAPSYIVAGALYFLLCYPLATFARNYEKKLKNHEIPSVAVVEILPEVPEC